MVVEAVAERISQNRWRLPVEDHAAIALASPTRSPEPVELDMNRVVIREGYRQVIQALAEGDARAARDALRDMEIGATTGRPPQAIIDLAKMEGRVLEDLAAGEWDRLLPFVVLYGEMIDDYRRRLHAPLSENAILLSTEMAQHMARESKGPEESDEAAAVLTSLAGHLLYSQRLSKTEELLELAVKRSPSNVPAMLALAATHEQQGDYSSAIKILKPLLEVDPDNVEGRLRLGVNLSRLGDSERALEALGRALAADQVGWEGPVAVQETARIRARKGDLDVARRDLEKAVERWPGQSSLKVQLAWVLDLAAEPVAARKWVADLQRSSEQASDSARYRYVDWYSAGMEELRQWLSKRSAERARALEAELAARESDGAGL